VPLYEVEGIDLSPAMLELARRRLPDVFLHGPRLGVVAHSSPGLLLSEAGVSRLGPGCAAQADARCSGTWIRYWVEPSGVTSRE
jgi:hypothetical protein